jgi:hypothetical protein
MGLEEERLREGANQRKKYREREFFSIGLV